MSLIFRVVYYCSIAWPILDDSEYWVSLVAWMVKHLPTMWKTWVRSLGWEDPLKKEMPTHSSNFAWIIPMDREACWATVHWVSKSQT